MPGISRKDQDTAGGKIIEGSSNVFANGKGVVRKGDAVAGHDKSPHDAPVMVGCSPNVFANGICVVREGDAASCGHTASGSSDVFAN